jgi:hypothetical protein
MKMKQKMRASYDNEEDLREDIVRAWTSIDISYVKKLYASLPARLSAVIKAKGDSTKY